MDLTEGMEPASVGEALSRAGRLSGRVMCIHGADEPPAGSIPAGEVDRCIARAIFIAAGDHAHPPLFVSADDRGCCPGGMGWLGLRPIPREIAYFVSSGLAEFRGGAAEHLKASPALFWEAARGLGRIAPPGRCIVIEGSRQVETGTRVCAYSLFAPAESVRNLCALVHFGCGDPRCGISAPWGPACASLVTYPAGMAEGIGRETIALGPMDPTVNRWFPDDHLSMGIPARIARRMAADLERSFLVKRPNVAYPRRGGIGRSVNPEEER